MRKRSNHFVIKIASGIALMSAAQIASAQSDTSSTEPLDISSVSKISRIQDNIDRATARHSLYSDASDFYGEYSTFKTKTAKENGISWSMDLSYLQQWGRSNGGSPAGQWLATPSLDWNLFQNDSIGTGSLQFAYTWVRYGTNQNGADIQNNLGLLTPNNDFGTRQNTFAQLTYTQALPGNQVLISVGQYPFYNFDGNQYLSSQQQNFNNDILSQNGTSTYATAGLGSYIQINPSSTLQFATGFQSADNISGSTLSTKHFGDGGYSWFAYAQWTPKFEGLGSAQYSMTYYQVPSVRLQSPKSHGWSFNAVQNLNDSWAVFGRANQASGYTTAIKSSYALGAALNNPLQRSPTDQIGLALGYSDVAKSSLNSNNLRNEQLIELYWNWTIAKGLLITPDVQYVRNPGANPSRDNAWTLSLRSTLMF
ncbi:carbohydrate porin [Deefgea salmonis]|uniref:Carbohydrate porin n=1 Tax=Deefgea salmonis TaxID=2875502 RepID=A0ABS8BJ39_9NEIS|nr:carbohydrate porin [Deefgea salmonis]MCB5195739.1 carbohydrate porin [Deefgea salmonis]